jgi:proteasome component ECM29
VKCIKARRSTFSASRFARACRKAGNHSEQVSLPLGLSPADVYRLLLEHALARDGTAELHETATNGLLEVAAADPTTFAASYAPRLNLLRQHLGHTDINVREAVAKLIGIAISALEVDRVKGLLGELSGQFEAGTKGRFEETHGAIAAAGYVLAQCMTGAPDVGDLGGSVTGKLGKALLNPTIGLAAGAAEALGHIGLRGPLPLPEGEKEPVPEEEKTAGSGSADPAVQETKETPAGKEAKRDDGPEAKVTRALVVKRLVGLLSDKDMKTVQAAALALGHLCHGDRSPALAAAALKGLFALLGTKHEDTLFAVGEALAFVWGGVPVTAEQLLKSDFVSLVASSNFLLGDTEAGEAVMAEAGEGACTHRGAVPY